MDFYNADTDLKHTLYNGTTIIQTRRFGSSKVLALVIRTGYVTTKGNLVRDILYPRPNTFRFYRDSMRFIALMACLAIVGFLCTIPVMVRQGYPLEDIIDRSLDLITITVPPQLPFAMTAATLLSLKRLRKK
jgi:magnesium-transporting ATPase (P-type)